MNCAVCGAQLERGKDFCPNCGTKLIEMPGGGKGTTFGKNNEQMQASQYQNELNFTKDYNKVNVKKTDNSSKVGNIVAIILLILMLGGFAAYWFWIRPMQTKVFDLDRFSIEMPKTMEAGQDGSNILGSVNQGFSQDGISITGNGYENSDVCFVYLVMDFTEYKEIQTGGLNLENLSPETLITAMEPLFELRSDYQFISSGSDYIKCKYNDSENNTVYMQIKIMKKDKVFYMFGMGCKEDVMDRYEPKISKWMNTITLK